LEDNRYRVLSLSVVPNVALVELPIAYECYNDASGHYTDWSTAPVAFNKQGVYRHHRLQHERLHQEQRDRRQLHLLLRHLHGLRLLLHRERPVRRRRLLQGGHPDGYDHTDLYSFSPCSYGFLVGNGNHTFHQDDLQINGQQHQEAGVAGLGDPAPERVQGADLRGSRQGPPHHVPGCCEWLWPRV
jgi:hypothetical protein